MSRDLLRSPGYRVISCGRLRILEGERVRSESYFVMSRLQGTIRLDEKNVDLRNGLHWDRVLLPLLTELCFLLGHLRSK